MLLAERIIASWCREKGLLLLLLFFFLTPDIPVTLFKNTHSGHHGQTLMFVWVEHKKSLIVMLVFRMYSSAVRRPISSTIPIHISVEKVITDETIRFHVGLLYFACKKLLKCIQNCTRVFMFNSDNGTFQFLDLYSRN